MVRIYGSVPFSNKKEKLATWRDLKREFGDSIKIIIKDNIMTYSCKIKSESAYF